MNKTEAKVYKISPLYAEIIDTNAKKYGITTAEYISLCVKFCHKTNFYPSEETLKGTKTIEKFRMYNQLKKLEVEQKNNINEIRNTVISFIKQQEKELLKPIKAEVDDTKKWLEYYYLKQVELMIELITDDPKTKQLLRKKFIK